MCTLKKIENLRLKLYNEIRNQDEYNISNDTLVELSQLLDKLIVQYENERINSINLKDN